MSIPSISTNISKGMSDATTTINHRKSIGNTNKENQQLATAATAVEVEGSSSKSKLMNSV